MSTRSLSPKGGESSNKKKSSKRKEVSTRNDEGDAGTRGIHPLARNPLSGMDPKTLLTGFYGTRGERIRHSVLDGALSLPPEALEIMLEKTNDTESVEDEEFQNKEKRFLLPGLDSVVRPSVDPKLGSIVVTEVSGVVVPGDAVRPAYLRSVATNKVISTTARTANAITGGEAERIRGGGIEEEQKHQPGVDVVMGEAASPLEKNSAASQVQSATGTAPGAVAADRPTPSPNAQVQPIQAVASASQNGASVTSNATSAAALATSSPNAPASVQPPRPASNAPVPAGSSISPTQAPTTAIGGSHVTNQPATVAPSSSAKVDDSAPSITTESKQQAPSTQTPVTSNPTVVVSSSTQSQPQQQPQQKQVAIPQVTGLKKRPVPQWEQHVPGPNDEMQVDPSSKTPKPKWYKTDGISDLERTVLPEWFNNSASHRTPETYKKSRETILRMSHKMGNRYVTRTMVRRAVPGDAGSLLRLHDFLSSYAMINEDAQNDSAPTPAVFQQGDKFKQPMRWNEHLRENLMEAVVDQAKKRAKLEDPSATSSFVPIDWGAVAATVGHGSTSEDCERQFLAMPVNDTQTERSITPDIMTSDQDHKGAACEETIQPELQKQVFQALIDKTDPKVVHAVINAALQTTNNLAEAQRASLVGLVASQATEEARSEEDAVSRILAEIIDLRMKKLENRIAIMDDVEGLLEAERVALELERRDLYTARCRHWFGGS